MYIVELSFLFYSSILLDESKTGLLVLSHILPPSAAGSMQDDVVGPSRIRFLRFVRARVAMSNQPKYLSIALTSLSLFVYTLITATNVACSIYTVYILQRAVAQYIIIKAVKNIIVQLVGVD